MTSIGGKGRPLSADENPHGVLMRFDRVMVTYVAIIYASVSMAYILLSDLVLYRSGDEHWTTLTISVGKGFAFVIVSAILIYLLIRWNDKKGCNCRTR